MIKNVATKIFFIAFALLCVGIFIPKYLISENPYIENITQEERIEVIEFAHQHRDNPLQRILTLKTVIDEREGDTFYVGTYSFFGIRCELVKITGGSARTVYTNQICEIPIVIFATIFSIISWIANSFSFE